MDALLYHVARTLLRLIQALPIETVARLGRGIGALFYVLDARHRRVALANLTAAFGHEQPPAAIRALARENFRRIGENFACAARTAAMSDAELLERLEVKGLQHFFPESYPHVPQTFVVAIGHFGNFEIYARTRPLPKGNVLATTYRGLRQPGLERLLRELRERSGTVFFERRAEATALRQAMHRRGIVLGLLADQHAGNRGLWIPFFGRACSTSPAPFVFARRFDCPLHTGICYRTGLARWRVEYGPAIPLEESGQPRSAEAVMTDVNRIFETAIRRDPANWFWVHNRWKEPRRPPRSPKGTSEQTPAADLPGDEF